MAALGFYSRIVICFFVITSVSSASLERESLDGQKIKSKVLLSMAPMLDSNGKKLSSIPSVHRSELSSKIFFKNYVSKSLPVLIRDGTIKWPDFENTWTDENLKLLVGNLTVKAIISNSPIVPIHRPGHKVKHIKMQRFLSHYLDSSSRRLYLDNISVNKKLKPLLKLMKKPAYAGLLDSVGQKLWMGSGKDVLPPRLEKTNDILLCVSGNVELWLYPPTDTNYLYPMCHSKGHHLLFYSEIVANRPGPKTKKKFPQYRRAHPIVVKLGSGDMVYVPAYWWHRVYSHDRHLLLKFKYHSTSTLADLAFEAARKRVAHWRDSIEEAKKPKQNPGQHRVKDEL